MAHTEMTGITRYHTPATENVDQELIDRLTVLLEGCAEVRAAYLFGSRARGTQGAGSDIDVAVMFAPDASAWSEVDLQEQLASHLGAPVQIVNLAYAGSDIVEAVHKDGITLVGDAQLLEGHRTMGKEREDARADEATWLLESAADKVQRIDSALPLLSELELDPVLAGEMTAVRDFLGVFMLLIQPLETLVRRVSRYANLVLGYTTPEATLRAQTTLAAQVMGVSDEARERIGRMARLRGRLAHAYWDLDADEIKLLTPEQLQPALEHLVERASRFIVVEQARWQRHGSRPEAESNDQ